MFDALAGHGFTDTDLVYVQHHCHAHVGRCAQLLRTIGPRLLVLGINGMLSPRRSRRRPASRTPFGRTEAGRRAQVGVARTSSTPPEWRGGTRRSASGEAAPPPTTPCKVNYPRMREGGGSG